MGGNVIANKVEESSYIPARKILALVMEKLHSDYGADAKSLTPSSTDCKGDEVMEDEPYEVRIDVGKNKYMVYGAFDLLRSSDGSYFCLTLGNIDDDQTSYYNSDLSIFPINLDIDRTVLDNLKAGFIKTKSDCWWAGSAIMTCYDGQLAIAVNCPNSGSGSKGDLSRLMEGTTIENIIDSEDWKSIVNSSRSAVKGYPDKDRVMRAIETLGVIKSKYGRKILLSSGLNTVIMPARYDVSQVSYLADEIAAAVGLSG